MNNNIAIVAVEKTFFNIDSDFDYLIPDDLVKEIKIGTMVKVPFGNGNRLRDGIVVNLYSAINTSLKSIKSTVGDKPLLSAEAVSLALWLKERCFCTTYECLRLMLPRGIGNMIGPASMIVTGMLIAEMNIRNIFENVKVYFISFLRLVVIPVISLMILKISGLVNIHPDGKKLLLIVFLAVITPSASTITQMCQVYGNDSKYASAINVMTTLLSIITMPLMVLLYQTVM